jgi:hypothetical protein|mmetsp:Transcript_16478/g.29975  ORF Transcript_16478/g.29975 Transcript_16478/m.29975 type:complete len:119 (+) Transcript_16478:233-589(+)
MMGMGQQQHFAFGKEVSVGDDLKERPAAKIHKNPDEMAKPPAFAIVHPFEHTSEAKNTMVMNMQNAQRAYSTAMRLQVFGWYTTHIEHQVKITVIPPRIFAMIPKARAALYELPKISF